MPETLVRPDGAVALRGLTAKAAEESRLAIASDVERLAPEGTEAIIEALREAGPAVTLERLDAPLVARAWLGREWCAWALVDANDSGPDETEVRCTHSGQIGAIIARIMGLGPGPERSPDDEPLVCSGEELAAWCTDEEASRWRVRITANSETGDDASFEAMHHPSRGWFLALPASGADGSLLSLFPTTGRFLWCLLLASLTRACPTVGY
jgi:hypothetical protein